jgi:hypothetical protein
MTARRTVTTAALGGALLLTLAGCQKPAPQVTVVSGGDSAHAEARQYCGNGAIRTTSDCLVKGAPAQTVLQVRQGDTVGIDVDKALTKKAWSVYNLDTRQIISNGYLKGHYFSFPADFSNASIKGLIRLQVTSLGALPKSDTDVPPLKGIWLIELAQKA